MKPLIVGQSPARSGDGRPFTGASGMRLCRLLALPQDYEALIAAVDLTNIFRDIPAKRPGIKGDPFDVSAAKFLAMSILERELSRNRVDIILCGGKTATAFGVGHMKPLTSETFVSRRAVGFSPRVRLHMLPHPSGINLFWNDPEQTGLASRFLRRIVYGA